MTKKRFADSKQNYGEQNAEQIRKDKIKEEKTHEKSIKTVRVKLIKNKTISNNIESSGRVVSLNNITISSEVQGRLVGTYSFKKGTKIKEGAIIFTIKNTDLKLLIEAKKSRFMNLVSSTLSDNSKIYYDYGHYTVGASKYFGKKIYKINWLKVD